MPMDIILAHALINATIPPLPIIQTQTSTEARPSPRPPAIAPSGEVTQLLTVTTNAPAVFVETTIPTEISTTSTSQQPVLSTQPMTTLLSLILPSLSAIPPVDETEKDKVPVGAFLFEAPIDTSQNEKAAVVVPLKEEQKTTTTTTTIAPIPTQSAVETTITQTSPTTTQSSIETTTTTTTAPPTTTKEALTLPEATVTFRPPIEVTTTETRLTSREQRLFLVNNWQQRTVTPFVPRFNLENFDGNLFDLNRRLHEFLATLAKK
jgi:hypothetical protein